MNENVFWALKDLENTWFFSSIVDFCSIVDLFLLSFILFRPNLFNVILWVDKQPYHCAFRACKSRCSYFNSAMLMGAVS